MKKDSVIRFLTDTRLRLWIFTFCKTDTLLRQLDKLVLNCKCVMCELSTHTYITVQCRYGNETVKVQNLMWMDVDGGKKLLLYIYIAKCLCVILFLTLNLYSALFPFFTIETLKLVREAFNKKRVEIGTLSHPPPPPPPPWNLGRLNCFYFFCFFGFYRLWNTSCMRWGTSHLSPFHCTTPSSLQLFYVHLQFVSLYNRSSWSFDQCYVINLRFTITIQYDWWNYWPHFMCG